MKSGNIFFQVHFFHKLQNVSGFKQTKQKQIHRYREQTDGCQKGNGLRNWVKKLRKLRSKNWLLENNHGDIKYSTGITVDNIVINMYSARWVLEIPGGITL